LANWYLDWFGASGGGTTVLEPTVATTGDLDPITRGDEYACTLTNVPGLAAADEIYVTAKETAHYETRDDAHAEFQISLTAGLIIVGRDAPTVSQTGSLERSGTSLTVRLNDDATNEVSYQPLSFDVKTVTGGVTLRRHIGAIVVNPTVTNATSVRTL
jgi:hypothetical protein